MKNKMRFVITIVAICSILSLGAMLVAGAYAPDAGVEEQYVEATTGVVERPLVPSGSDVVPGMFSKEDYMQFGCSEEWAVEFARAQDAEIDAKLQKTMLFEQEKERWIASGKAWIEEGPDRSESAIWEAIQEQVLNIERNLPGAAGRLDPNDPIAQEKMQIEAEWTDDSNPRGTSDTDSGATLEYTPDLIAAINEGGVDEYLSE